MKKILRVLSIAIIAGVLICLVPLSACGAIYIDGEPIGPVSYLVSFNRGNIDDEAEIEDWPKAQSVNRGGTAVKPGTDPYAEGWVFNGWYAAKDATSLYDFSSTEIMSNTVIYAGWTFTGTTPDNPSPDTPEEPAATYYTVTFNLGSIDADITGGPASVTVRVAEGSTVTEPADPSAEGYTFLGWYTAADGDTGFSFSTQITKDTTIYAHWAADSTDTPGEPEEGTPVTVALKLPEGFYVSEDWNRSYTTGEDLAVPAEDQITNETGETLSCWYVKYEGLSATEAIQADPADSSSGSAKVWDNCTLMPCFGCGMDTGFNTNGTSGIDSVSSSSATSEWSVTPAFFDDDFTAGKQVKRYGCVSGDWFRFSTAYSVTAGQTYCFQYKLANRGTDDLDITVYQVPSGTDVTVSGTVSRTLSIAAGETKTFTLTFPDPSVNGNILPIFYVNNTEAVTMKLGIRIKAVDEPSDEVITTVSSIETAESGSHDPIYYWASEDKVPYDSTYTTDYDSGARAYNYCFMTPYLAKNPTGGAVLVFAGGGYNYCSNSYGNNGKDNNGRQGEASAIAEWYNAAGISVFVVNYRTKAVLNHSGIYHELLSDCMRAIRYLRYHAEEYSVDPGKIAAMGYSAGGNIASLLLNSYSRYTIDDTLSGGYVSDEIDEVSAKADAGVFGYGVLGLSQSYADGGTSSSFSGYASVREQYCPYLNITADTAPCFIWQETTDGTVSPSYATDFAAGLETAGVQYELHLFNDSSQVTSGTYLHGIGVAQDYTHAKVWPTYATNFLKTLGF
ncbi:MAG: InlB B-repeat-containing protein [Clostridia bacterium]|nr:InlB B-repeat-containing protein [Clostridia bacterium]